MILTSNKVLPLRQMHRHITLSMVVWLMGQILFQFGFLIFAIQLTLSSCFNAKLPMTGFESQRHWPDMESVLPRHL